MKRFLDKNVHFLPDRAGFSRCTFYMNETHSYRPQQIARSLKEMKIFLPSAASMQVPGAVDHQEKLKNECALMQELEPEQAHLLRRV